MPVVDISKSAWLPLIGRSIVNSAPGPDLVRQLLRHCDQGPYQREFAVRGLERAVTTLDDLALRDWQAFLQSTAGANNEVAQEQVKETVKQALRFLINAIHTRHDEKLGGLAISVERITSIERYCNHSAANAQRAAAPVPYFEHVTIVDQQYPPVTGRLPKANKAELVTPQLAPIVSNEETWYRRIVRDFVAIDVMQKVIAQLDPTMHLCGTAEEYSQALEKAGAQFQHANLSPLLLVGGRRDANSRWRPTDHSLPKAEWPIQFEKLEGFVDPGYVGHVNGIAAILVPIPIGSAFLVPRELFQRLRFTDQGNEQAVRLRYVEQADNEVQLDVTWAADIELAKLPVHGFQFEVDNPAKS